MHDDPKRQLLALSTALLVALGSAPGRGEDRRAATVKERLQAAKSAEMALLSRDASATEWRELDRLYADLAAQYPRDARAQNAHAERLWSIEEHDRAMAEWEAAERIEPTNAVVLDHLAGGWLALGQVKKAAAFAARAVRSAPDHAAYHFTLANLLFLFRHELTDEAYPDSEAVLVRSLEQFAAASRLAPLSAEYARAYAETFYSVKNPDWQAALAAWLRFLSRTTQSDFAWSNVARVQLKLGRVEAAQESLKKMQGAGFLRLRTLLEAQAALQGQASVGPPAPAVSFDPKIPQSRH